MPTQSTIIAAAFDQESQARRALNALKQAGFGYDQIGLATQAQRGIDLKSNLLGLHVSREQADYYDQQFNAGRTVISVRTEGREREVHDLLHQYNGYDYEHQTLETQTAAGYTRDAAPLSTQTATDDVRDEFHQPRSLKLREEQLNVTKERVQVGEVGLRKEVVTEQKTITVPVTHEEVVIERHAVTGGTVDTSTPIGEGEVVRVPVSEEQVNVTKNTVVTGEVAIGKRVVGETQQVTDTIRREEAHIERTGDVNVQGDIDPRKP